MTPRFCEKCGAGLEGEPTACPRCGQPLAKKGMSTCAIIGIIAAAMLVCGIFVTGILAAILIPNFMRARAQGQMTACCSNLKNIATGLEMWSTDNQGHYPDTLDQITPNYLKVLPTCPAALIETYSSSYTSTKPDPEKGTADSYRLFCRGSNHSAAGVPPDYPQYTSTEGCIRGIPEQ